MKINEVTETKKYTIYFDYTGAGRKPEKIAGPFDSIDLAKKYAKEHDWDVTSNSNYFID